MRRPILMVLLGLGAIFGFTSGIAHIAYGSSHWGRCGGHARWAQDEQAQPPVQQQAPTIVVQPPAPAAPAAPVYPQIIVIPQGATQVPVQVPSAAPAAPAPTPAK